MAEIYVKDGETKEEVARRLLDQAAHPDHVVWQPRSGVAEGGIFYVPDDEVDDLVARVQAKRDAERKLTEQRIAAADERDAKVADTGLTPDQLGFSANATGDPGSFPVEDDDDLELDEDGEPVNEPGQAPPAAEEPKLSRAEQRRLDRKRAADEAKAAEKAQADTTTADPAEKTDKE